MAVPVLLWGAAAALAATGVVKGAGAVIDINKAKDIGERAERRHRRRMRELDEVRDETNKKFTRLGELKVSIFNNQIKHLLEVVHNSSSKQAKSALKDFHSTFSLTELKEIESMVEASLDLGTNFGSSAIAGALAGLGAYGSVPLIATASTGTAISTLSGAAATNATLAWLGGGSLAAGGMIALGGIVAGPALAVGGFMLAGKAEEALTQAYRYDAQVDEAVAQLNLVEEGLNGLQKNAEEVQYALVEMVQRFEDVRADSAGDENFHSMLLIGRALKDLMDIKIINDNGSPVPNIRQRCEGCLNIEVGAA